MSNPVQEFIQSLKEATTEDLIWLESTVTKSYNKWKEYGAPATKTLLGAIRIELAKRNEQN